MRKSYRFVQDLKLMITASLLLIHFHTPRPGAAYETATLRQFYHGRTETMRSCTPEAIDWCKAMLDPNAEVGHYLRERMMR